MKYAFYIILFLSIASVVVNVMQLDFGNLLVGDSQIALISIVAALCVVVLMVIMLMSFRIRDKQ